MTEEERQKLRDDLLAGISTISWLLTSAADALARSNTEPDPTKVICPNCTHQFTAISVADQERLRAQSEAKPVAATSHSLLRPANQKPTICYCKPGECSAPKPEWCVGRRYADGFREVNAKQVAGHSTSAMRARIRELARPDSDDYDRAVIAVLDDFDDALVGLEEKVHFWQGEAEKWMKTVQSIDRTPRPDTSEMDQLKADLSNTYQRLETTQVSEEGWKKRCQFIEAELDEARASRPDASAGLIEAAEITREWAGATSSLVEAHLLDALARELRARAADRSGK